MEKKAKFSAEKRDVFGRKTNAGRRQGKIPAVIYGRGIKTESLWIDELEFSRLLKKSGESTVISLEVKNGKEGLKKGEKEKKEESVDSKNNRNAIIYEIQNDPMSGKIIHVDFFQVKMDEEIETEVEISYVGESPAVKEQGGVLVKNIDEVTVKCLPTDLPSEIKVDISNLKTFDDYIYIKDLNVSSKVKIDLDPETVVALVSPPRTEQELEELSEKVEEDVSKVDGMEKEETSEGQDKEEKKEDSQEAPADK